MGRGWRRAFRGWTFSTEGALTCRVCPSSAPWRSLVFGSHRHASRRSGVFFAMIKPPRMFEWRAGQFPLRVDEGGHDDLPVSGEAAGAAVAATTAAPRLRRRSRAWSARGHTLRPLSPAESGPPSVCYSRTMRRRGTTSRARYVQPCPPLSSLSPRSHFRFGVVTVAPLSCGSPTCRLPRCPETGRRSLAEDQPALPFHILFHPSVKCRVPHPCASRTLRQGAFP